MRGRVDGQAPCSFHTFSVEDRTRPDHPLRDVERRFDRIPDARSPKFAAADATTGRPSVPPVNACSRPSCSWGFVLHSQLGERIDAARRFRWFLDLPPGDDAQARHAPATIRTSAGRGGPAGAPKLDPVAAAGTPFRCRTIPPTAWRTRTPTGTAGRRGRGADTRDDRLPPSNTLAERSTRSRRRRQYRRLAEPKTLRISGCAHAVAPAHFSRCSRRLRRRHPPRLRRPQSPATPSAAESRPLPFCLSTSRGPVPIRPKPFSDGGLTASDGD